MYEKVQKNNLNATGNKLSSLEVRKNIRVPEFLNEHRLSKTIQKSKHQIFQNLLKSQNYKTIVHAPELSIKTQCPIK